MTKDNSPYLLVDEEKGCDSSSLHVLNPLSAESRSAPLSVLATAASVLDGTGVPIVSKQSVFSQSGFKIALCTAIFAACTFLSFCLAGSIPGIGVQSSIVTVAEVLSKTSCTEHSGLFSGSLDFSALRLLLAVGVLGWLYGVSSLALTAVQQLSVYFCLGKARNSSSSQQFPEAVGVVTDFIFCVLCFLAFVIAAVSISAPQKMRFQGAQIYFNLETLYLSLDGICVGGGGLTSPLPVIRAAVALMFFAFCAASMSLLARIEARVQQQIAKKANYDNCL